MASNGASSSASSSRLLAAPSLRDKARLPRLPPTTTLDRSAFSLRIPVLGARVEASRIGPLKARLTRDGQIMDIPRTSVLRIIPGSSDKLLRLRAGSEEELSKELRQSLDGDIKGYEQDVVELDYTHWSASDILTAILPQDIDEEVPSSFTQTGHIGHVNLRNEWLAYKYLIGQVILDKNSQLRTVVNKLDTIHAEYRYFDMEVIAGEPDFIATVNESSCSFTLDFQKVYWNSRLHHEHERLVALFRPGEIVADVMAGVGPFAVPAAKKGCRVLGNDLNPEGVKWMEVNRVKNKVEDNLRVSEMDGRQFIRSAGLSIWTHPFPPYQPVLSRKQRDKAARLARQGGSVQVGPQEPSPVTAGQTAQRTPAPPPVLAPNSAQPEPPHEIDHFVMNLPDSALTFLDAFRGCYTSLVGQTGYSRESAKMPMVHVYCFTRELDPGRAEADICQRASEYLGNPVSASSADFGLHLVRSVAPNKDMYCLSFRLPGEVAFAES